MSSLIVALSRLMVRRRAAQISATKTTAEKIITMGTMSIAGL